MSGGVDVVFVPEEIPDQPGAYRERFAGVASDEIISESAVKSEFAHGEYGGIGRALPYVSGEIENEILENECRKHCYDKEPSGTFEPIRGFGIEYNQPVRKERPSHCDRNGNDIGRNAPPPDGTPRQQIENDEIDDCRGDSDNAEDQELRKHAGESDR